MNKLVIPAILVSITLVAGVFAFMPVEKASTVHTTIATNVDDQDRTLFYLINGTRSTVTGFDLIPASPGKDLAGTIIVTATPEGASTGLLNCGVSSTDGGTSLAANATAGTPGTAAFTTAGAGTPAGFVTGEGIELSISSITEGGECAVTIFLDSGDT